VSNRGTCDIYAGVSEDCGAVGDEIEV